MEVALTLVTLVAAVTLIGAGARRADLPTPLVLMLVGAGASFVPWIPTVELEPELLLVGVLPALLYAQAIGTSLVDFRANLRPIGLLSVGLVAFTAAGIGLLVYWLLPIPLAAAFAIGAVVAPTDAVAATAIARRVGMPRRIVTILEGESLVNDATALVLFRSAVAGIAGSVTIAEIGRDFALSLFGGAAAGLLIAWVVKELRRRVTDPFTDVSLSLIAPFAAYLLAEEIHGSGFLAVVAAGLMLGHVAPVVQTAPSRVLDRSIWATVQYLLENGTFLLIGLQVQAVVEALGETTLSPARITVTCLVVLVATMLLRPLWIAPATYLTRLIPRIARRDPAPPWQYPTVLAWAGMRGVVTLAAAFALPASTPHREVLNLLALVVVVGSLLLQGSTLPWVVRRLAVTGPSAADDALHEAETHQRAASAGLARLDEISRSSDPPEVVDQLRTRTLQQARAVWERLGRSGEGPSQVYRRLRLAMLVAERAEVLRIRDDRRVPHEVLQRVLDTLDFEETILTASSAMEHDAPPTATSRPASATCTHLGEIGADVDQAGARDACVGCLAEGTTWVHLRMCLTCGYVGCCDSSTVPHANRHFEETGHPVMRSIEPGESWRWCYVDEILG